MMLTNHMSGDNDSSTPTGTFKPIRTGEQAVVSGIARVTLYVAIAGIASATSTGSTVAQVTPTLAPTTTLNRPVDGVNLRGPKLILGGQSTQGRGVTVGTRVQGHALGGNQEVRQVEGGHFRVPSLHKGTLWFSAIGMGTTVGATVLKLLTPIVGLGLTMGLGGLFLTSWLGVLTLRRTWDARA